jgi:hypothetical protein
LVRPSTSATSKHRPKKLSRRLFGITSNTCML